VTRARAVNLMWGLMLDDGRTGIKTYGARVSLTIKACFMHTDRGYIYL